MPTGFGILIWPHVARVSKPSAFNIGISSGRNFANGSCLSMVTSIRPQRLPRSPTRLSSAFDFTIKRAIPDKLRATIDMPSVYELFSRVADPMMVEDASSSSSIASIYQLYGSHLDGLG
jgi:hypothetical protein